MTFYSVLGVTPTTEDWVPDYIDPRTHASPNTGGSISLELTATKALKVKAKTPHF